MNDYLTYADAS